MKKICVLLMALVMMFALTTSAFAVISPSGDKNYTVKHYVVSMITNETSYQWYKVIPEGDAIRLVVDDKYINQFVKWDIEGEYELISGTFTDKEIVIRPGSDLDVYLYVNAETEGPSNDSPESPDTATPIAGLIAVMAVAGCAAVVAKKQISK